MKNGIVLLMLMGFLFSCNKDDDKAKNELIGKWKLIEVLADPGDGSGIFEPVESNKVIEFYEDGTVNSNGILCSMSIEANTPTSETYSLADSTISSLNCIETPPLNIWFELKGSILIINYPCIEDCKAKYEKTGI